MKTTEEWLAEIKESPEKLNAWLVRQYIGEKLAAERISELGHKHLHTHGTVLFKLSLDEDRHAYWVSGLLHSRNIPLPKPTYEKDRYWSATLKGTQSFEELTGAGHHAETMRLVRIKALAADTEIPVDIREVFARILPDEERHVTVFAALSTPEAIEATRDNHQKGLEALGLTI